MNAATAHNRIQARRRAVGMLYVDLGLLTRAQLNHALVESARLSRPLPEVLTALGYLG